MPAPSRSAATNAAIGPLPVPRHRDRLAVDEQLGGEGRHVVVVGGDLVAAQLRASAPRAGRSSVNASHISTGADLGAGVLGDGLDALGELDLQPTGQGEAVLGLHDVGHAALARLAVDPDDGLVGAADVGRVDGQVGHVPDLVVVAAAGGLGVGVERGEALLDGVLVRAGERGVDEVADVGVALVHRQPVAVLGHAAQRVDVADVELGVDALAEQVHGQGDDVDVAGALAVAEQRALDPVGAGQHAQLGRGHRAAAVVVRVQRQDDRRRGCGTCAGTTRWCRRRCWACTSRPWPAGS